MSGHWVIRIQKPQAKFFIACAIGGSLTAAAVLVIKWFISGHSLQGRGKKASAHCTKVSQLHGDRFLRGHNISEVSMSLKSHPQNEGFRDRTLSRDDMSVSSAASIAIDCGKIGLNALDSVIEKLEECMLTIHKPIYKLGFNDPSTDIFVNELQNFLETSYLLRERYKRVFIQQVSTSAAELSIQDSMSDVETQSFFSTAEEIDFSELEVQIMSNFHRPFYRSALRELNDGNVLCRSVRTDMMRCQSNVEYVGKLVCIRRGFDYILSRSDQVDWMTKTGRTLACALLDCLGYATEDFEDSFGCMMVYINTICAPENQMQLIDELASKGIQSLNFYDIVFDHILIDALENLGNPPSSILMLTRNSWLSNDFKRSALGSAVWTLLTAKRKLLKYPDGFFSSYYRVVETVAPALAWGFLGSEENLNAFCESIRDEIVTFLRSLFRFAESKIEAGDASGTASITEGSVYLEANEEGYDYEDDYEEDDDVTITPGEDNDANACQRDATASLEAYNGVDLNSLTTVADCIVQNMSILEKRMSSLIKDFAVHNNIQSVSKLLRALPKCQPSLPVFSNSRI